MSANNVVKRGGATSHREEHQTCTATANAAINIPAGTVELNHASVVIAATFAKTPGLGAQFLIWHAGGGTAAHTLTLPSGMTFDGTNNTATLNALDESLLIRVVSSTRVHVLINNGSVALSSV